MAVARTKTVAFQGIDTLEIDVQIQMTNGMPAFTVVGLPDKAVGESRERVRAALGSIAGFGAYGYELALDAASKL